MLRRFNNPLRVPIVKAGQHTSRPVYEILFSKLATSTGDSSSPRAAKEVALLHSHHITNLGCWRDAPASVRQALAASSEEGKEAAQILDAALQEEGESLKDVANKKILICYGSQTGTAEGLAKMTALMAKSTAGLVPVIATMNDAVNLLTSRDDLQFASILIICSTYGVGDVPTNGLKFLEQLNKSGSALQNKLKSIPSAVLGLGNSQNTDNFNAAAKKITAKLQEIGSAQLIPPIYSCELAEEGHDAKFRIYKAACWSAMAKRQIGSGDKTATQGLADLYEASPCIGIKAEKTHSRSFQRVDWFPATVTYNEVKSAKGYEPAFRHMLVELDNRKVQEVLGRKLKPTDSLLVQPHNPAAYVNRALKLFGLTGDEVFDITPLPGASSNWFDGHKLSARTIFSEVIDLSGVPARSTIASLIPSATDAKDKAALEALANDLSAKNEYSALVKKIFTTIDLLERFPSLKLTLAQALSRLPAISPRHYSNCHHPQVLSNKFEIIYSIPTRHSGDVTHVGLATGGMAECKPGDSEIWISVEEGKTQLPPVEAPVVALGLGSGIGLVRAMLEERAAAAKAGTKVGKCVLIYGFHEVGKDQLFKEELDAHLKSGVISDLRYVASYEGAKFIKSPFDEINKDLAAFMNQPDTRLFYCGPGGLQRLLESQCRRAGINVRKMKAENRYIEEYFSPDQDADKLLKLHQAEANSQATLAEKFADSEMFCFQCEQTQHCKTGGVANFGIGGCAGKVGVCGKKASTAALQDLTVYYYKVLSFYLDAARAAGAPEHVAYNRLTLYSLFSTLTNVNFDDERFVKILADLHSAINTSKADYEAFCASKNMKPVTLPADQMQIDKTFNPDVKELIAAGRAVGVLTRFIDAGAQNAASVCEMLTFGLKGLAAYTDHALMNSREEKSIYDFMHKAGAFLVSRDRHDLGKAVGMCLELGKTNVTAMGLLYDSHEGSLSAPTLATAAVKPKPGKALLVSGHDLIILKKLLPLCDEAGINVYTHGEMLPAHGYEGLRKHKSLAGHYGGAWMRQALEFPHFPGPVLMTTNCLIENTEEVRARLFTAGAVGWPGCEHIGNTLEDINFKPLIAAALESPGFTANDTEFSYPDPVGTTRPANYTVGAGHKQILALAPVVLEEIQKGNITRFFLIGGCDGFEGSRNYYADLVKNLPPTTVILGVGCGKFRYNWMDLGTIPGGKIPRMLDLGQCSDSFSAVQVAVALAGALKCEVADLPLSIVLSWFEQKAVAVLLSCVALGLKTLRVGPALPSFVTNDVLNVLVKDMGILPLGDPAVDAKTMLAAKGMDDRVSVAAEGKGEKK